MLISTEKMSELKTKQSDRIANTGKLLLSYSLINYG